MLTIDGYLSIGDEPDPTPTSEMARQFENPLKELHEYSYNMFAVYLRTHYEGKRLWNDFRHDFRSHIVKPLSRPMAAEWAKFLVHRGIKLNEGKGVTMKAALLEILA